MLKILLICGILAALVQVGTDILAGNLYPGYSFTSQAVSELFAIGAPTSGLVVPLFTVYSVLLAAFALGVWMSSAAAAAGRNRIRRVMALMLGGLAVSGLMLWPFFPMHMRVEEATFTDTMHLAITGAGVIFALMAVGFGAAALGKVFRWYSIGTILILVVPGIFAFMYASQVFTNQPTPWLGLLERISQYGNALWLAGLAIVRLREEIDR